jgi:hypothetical protein
VQTYAKDCEVARTLREDMGANLAVSPSSIARDTKVNLIAPGMTKYISKSSTLLPLLSLDLSQDQISTETS